MSIYDITVKDIRGEEQSMSYYKGKVLLIVNTASKCGFTQQYSGLETIFNKYKEKGFFVLGFPCNQFNSQEPDGNETIQEFCQLNFGVTFPLFSKIDVNGKSAHPLYTHLKEEAKGILGSGSIKWNFTKFLVDSKGNVFKRYAPIITPDKIEKDIISLLDK